MADRYTRSTLIAGVSLTAVGLVVRMWALDAVLTVNTFPADTGGSGVGIAALQLIAQILATVALPLGVALIGAAAVMVKIDHTAAGQHAGSTEAAGRADAASPADER
ncbi:hypothetical protein ALI44B_11730 [Leifsonia sp. ALI-44-B]|uniref:hypothetical protein n=1 Tax=Leifsonia sp. ALI-44-B TaxID=1933776 RepID=UPI00097BF0F3|nr:hypothetical protein [Leifsonia sp. ALI-44-B]ONI61150.1 hypothetical protein ALI44B_11730 [Leifsonia sp. ALI-44-B]